MLALGVWAVSPAMLGPAYGAEGAGKSAIAPAYDRYIGAGRALLAQGRAADAAPYLAVDMAIRPESRLAEIYLSTLIGQHCFDWPVAVLENLRPILPDYVQLLECLGRRYEGTTDYRAAEEAYARWAGSHPDNAEPHARLGELFFFTKRYDKALAAFSRHRELVGDSHYAVRRMALSAVGQVTPPYAWTASQWFQENRGHGDIWIRSHWRPAAERGEVAAQYNMGMLTLNGWGGDADPAAALGWFRKAAAQGHVRAMVRVACASLTGEGTAQDLHQGFRLARRAALSGSARAHLLLGSLYAYGLGTEVNQAAAMTAYKKAAQAFAAEGRQGWVGVVVNAMRTVAPNHPFVAELSGQAGATVVREVAP